MYQLYVKFKSVIKKLVPRPIFNALINKFHLLEAVLANIRYGFPARGMKIIGVTGTNGKTTTSLMVTTILKEAGHKTGLCSSAFISTGGDIKLNDLPGRLTNPPPLVLQKLLREMRKNGVRWAVVETASHALDQHRVWGIKYAGAIITNITEDHLEYHGTMENYTRAKTKLFDMCNGVGVINLDDARADDFLRRPTPKKVTYGQTKNADYYLKTIDLKQKSTNVKLAINGTAFELKLKLVGEFNAYNATAAMAVTRELGIDEQVIKRGLESLERVPGRLDPVLAGQKYSVLIDDAHTPDAIENVLKAARAVTKGKLMIITGAAGERASSRRAPVGRIASSLADIFILTDDEPHHEDPDNVLKEIKQGIVKGKAEVIELTDRCDAMRKAFELAGDNDTIVIAGMGYKHHRDGPNGAEPWDDYKVAEDLIKGKTTEFEANWRQVMHETWPETR